jgi:hypothetical protein
MLTACRTLLFKTKTRGDESPGLSNEAHSRDYFTSLVGIAITKETRIDRRFLSREIAAGQRQYGRAARVALGVMVWRARCEISDKGQTGHE